MPSCQGQPDALHNWYSDGTRVYDAWQALWTLGLFREALCHRGFLGLGSKESLRFSTQGEAFDDWVQPDRIYRKKANL